jgi:hypothetical protein
VSQVIETSKERPYLSLRLDLDPTLVSAVMAEARHRSPQNHASVRAINVSALDASLLEVDAFLGSLHCLLVFSSTQLEGFVPSPAINIKDIHIYLLHLPMRGLSSTLTATAA